MLFRSLQPFQLSRHSPLRRVGRSSAVLALAGATAMFAAQPVIAESVQAAFAAENATAMDKMMAGMDVKPSGDVDHDFTAMMIPHHQGAIEMAQAELRYGHNEQLRRIAQEIIVEQQQEIAAMNLALGQPLPPSAPAPTQFSPAPTQAMSAGMAHHHAVSAMPSMPQIPNP
ncbi:MAG: hypothetical protein JWQ73_3080 [Variovorax sp.]|nr:hypothetical protein [Variovorax sp.]